MSRKDLAIVSQNIQRLSTKAVEQSKASFWDSRKVRENKLALRQEMTDALKGVSRLEAKVVLELSILEIDLRKGQTIAIRAIEHQAMNDQASQVQFDDVVKAVIQTNEEGVRQQKELAHFRGPIAELALRLLLEQTRKSEELLFSVIEK